MSTVTDQPGGVQPGDVPHGSWLARRVAPLRRRPGGGPAGARGAVARTADATLDTLVAAMAVWTLAYHVCLVAQLPAGWAALVEGLALPGCAWWGWRAPRPGPDDGPEPGRRWHGLRPRETAGPGGLARAVLRARRALFGVSAAASVAAAVLFTTHTGPWWLTWTLWLCAAGSAAAVALARAGEPGGDAARDGTAGTRAPGTWCAAGWAVLLGALSLFLNRPDGDDMYYVNVAGWVSEHGAFPLRDTVMSDEAFPMTYWPPVASYDALVGTVSRFSSVQVPNLVYFVVPPLVTALAVLALWRLLRSWRAPGIGVALTLALVFLLWDGEDSYAFGSQFIGRIWQDKALFLWLLLPLLLCYFQRFARDPAPRRLVPLAAAGVAAVGFSTNALFLVPLLSLAGAVAVLRGSTVRAAALAFLAAAAYPLAAAAATHAVGGYTPDGRIGMTQNLNPDWLVHLALGDGVPAGIALACMLAGAWFVRPRAARLLVAGASLAAALVLAPGMPALGYEVTGLGRTLHRTVWALPIAALVGAIGGYATTIRRPVVVRYLPAVAVVLAVVATGVPVWSPVGGPVRTTSVPEWKLSPGSWAQSQAILRQAGRGATVLVPDDPGRTIATIRVPLTPVLPKKHFVRPLARVPSFHARERLLLKEFVDGQLPADRYRTVTPALRLIGVDTACLIRPDRAGARLLRAAGYGPARHVAHLRCYSR